MPISLLCVREFSQLEIDQGIRVEHASSGRILLARFKNGNIHQFKLAKKQKPNPVPKGAFVAPPPAPTPDEAAPILAVTEATPETVGEQPPQGVETLAQDLDAHFHPVRPGPEPVVDMVDDSDFVDCTVVWVNPGFRGGIARRPGTMLGGKEGYFFNAADILTAGVETLRPGSNIRGRVIPPAPGKFS
jgi:hypothetical protein